MTLDLRSLAAFRIALALTILVDLVDRARSLMIYTDAGPAPFARLAEDGFVLSLYMFSEEASFVVALFVINAIVAFALGFGWRTRLMCVLALLLQLSLHERTFISSFAGDNLLRVLIFWGCLLPIGARLSIDSRGARTPQAIQSFSAAGLVLSMFCIFFFTGLEKVGSPLWRNGEALATYMDTWLYPTTLGRFVVDAVPEAFPFLTWSALVIELGGALLLLAPSWRLRLLGTVALFSVMLGIGLLIDAGLFPLITASGLVGLLPPAVWRDGSTAPPRARSKRELAAAACVATMLATNVLNLIERPLPLLVSSVLRIPALDQRWPMFRNPEASPHGWLLVVGRREGAPDFDVLRGVDANPTEVPPPMSTIMTFRERRVLQRGYLGGPGWEENVAAWLCRVSAQPISNISVGLAEIREPGIVRVVEIVKNQPCDPRASR